MTLSSLAIFGCENHARITENLLCVRMAYLRLSSPTVTIKMRCLPRVGPATPLDAYVGMVRTRFRNEGNAGAD